MPALTLELGPTAYELDFDVRVTFSARGEGLSSRYPACACIACHGVTLAASPASRAISQRTKSAATPCRSRRGSWTIWKPPRWTATKRVRLPKIRLKHRAVPLGMRGWRRDCEPR